MKKTTLLLILVLLSFLIYSQRVNTPTFSKGIAKKDFTVSKIKHKKPESINFRSKSGGNTIWSDDFHSYSTWNIHHVAGTTGDWAISASAGYNGSNYNSFNPPTKTNGYAGFNSNQYYAPPNPQPVMDAYLETANSINLTSFSHVTICWHQVFKAFNYDECRLEFSTNGGSTWSYSVRVNDIFVNTYSRDSITMNVSQYIAGQANVKLRFRYYSPSTDSINGGGYGWSIDDVRLYESYSNDIEITEIIPSFDNIDGGTFTYFPEFSPTRIFNSAIIQNNGYSNQTNTKLTVNINDQAFPYNKTSSGITSNSASYNDTLSVGYSGTTITNPFFLNCSDFISPIIPCGDIFNYNYNIIYNIQSDSTDQQPINNADTFLFHVGYSGSLYPYAPDLTYTFARNNQNPNNEDISPKNWSGGGADGDGVYMLFNIWDESGYTEIRNMDIFISNQCTFDIYSGMGATITGIIYKWDSVSSQWIQLIASNPNDLYLYDTLTWKNIPFLLNGSDELLSAGEYCAGIEITYNGYECYIGCDKSTVQSSTATLWRLPGSGNNNIHSISNFNYSPMLNVNVYSTGGYYQPCYSSVKNIDNNLDIKIYPNPATSIINIETPENSTIEVYNILGIKTAEIKKSTYFNTIDLSSFPEGNYIVKVIYNNGVVTNKISLVK